AGSDRGSAGSLGDSATTDRDKYVTASPFPSPTNKLVFDPRVARRPVLRSWVTLETYRGVSDLSRLRRAACALRSRGSELKTLRGEFTSGVSVLSARFRSA